MASVNKLGVTKALLNNKLFSIKKGFLGLSTTMTYEPTSSKVNAYIIEYNNADAERLERILRMDKEKMVNELATADLKPQDMGNARFEMLKSEDGACFVIQLYRFQDFSYRPVSDAIIIEGEAAATLAKIF